MARVLILWGYEIPQPVEEPEEPTDDLLVPMFGDVKAQLDRLTVVK